MNLEKTKFTAAFFSIVLAAIFSWSTKYIIGVGAAIAIPAEILRPLVQFSPTLGIAIIDFFVLGLPLAIGFSLFYFPLFYFFKRNRKTTLLFYLITLVCFVVYTQTSIHLKYGAIPNQRSFFQQAFGIFSVYLPIILCSTFLYRHIMNNDNF